MYNRLDLKTLESRPILSIFSPFPYLRWWVGVLSGRIDGRLSSWGWDGWVVLVCWACLSRFKRERPPERLIGRDSLALEWEKTKFRILLVLGCRCTGLVGLWMLLQQLPLLLWWSKSKEAPKTCVLEWPPHLMRSNALRFSFKVHWSSAPEA